MVKKILLTLVIVLVVIGLGFVIWADFLASDAMPLAKKSLDSDEQVEVNTEKWLVFQPTDVETNIGLIFYPGGRVKAAAYAPLARSIAKAGYPVVIVPMPLNLAVFGINRAEKVIKSYPEIQKWVLAGHSLGGAMATRFVANQEAPNEHLAGLVLLASYPAVNDHLSEELPVLSIYASNDGLATLEKIARTRERLPEAAQLFEIQGGNHSQFGWYGAQKGDFEAEISREEQQKQIREAILEFLSQLE